MARRDDVDAWVAGVIETPDTALAALYDELAKGTRLDRISRLANVVADGLGITAAEARRRAMDAR